MSITEALAESVVKIAARDVIATWKVLISLGLLLYCTVSTLLLPRFGPSAQISPSNGE